jgi:hypothetical protein
MFAVYLCCSFAVDEQDKLAVGLVGCNAMWTCKYCSFFTAVRTPNLRCEDCHLVISQGIIWSWGLICGRGKGLFF